MAKAPILGLGRKGRPLKHLCTVLSCHDSCLVQRCGYAVDNSCTPEMARASGNVTRRSITFLLSDRGREWLGNGGASTGVRKGWAGRVSKRGETFANCRFGGDCILNFSVTDNSGNGDGWHTGGGCEGSAHVMRRGELGRGGNGRPRNEREDAGKRGRMPIRLRIDRC